MARTSEIVAGNLEITEVPASTIMTLSEDEVIGKIAEAQTKVDHLNIDLTAARAEVTAWNTELAKFPA